MQEHFNKTNIEDIMMLIMQDWSVGGRFIPLQNWGKKSSDK